MWCRFDEYKQIIKDNDDSFIIKTGLDSAEFLKSISEIKGETVSEHKSKLISFILDNAEISINKEELFPCSINHSMVMHEFLSKNYISAINGPCKNAHDKANSFVSGCAFKANMDFGHIAPDWNYILNRGISGIIEDLNKYSENANDATNKKYYSERIAVFKSIKNCLLRFSSLAESVGTDKMLFVAENFKVLAYNKPETLAQAMQLILLFYVIQTDIDTVTIRSLGGLDRMLYPYYINDLKSGKYTKQNLFEITQYFLWKISCMGVTANLPFYICGLDSDGKDATNSFTELLLNCYRSLDIYDPKIQVLYHKDINPDVLNLLLEMIREGKNSFVFMNTEIISASLQKIGISEEDSKKVIVYGCYESAAEGTEIPCTCGGMINLAKSLEYVFNREESFETFDDFYSAVIKELENYTILCMNTISEYEKFYDIVCPSMIMSPTYRNSREKGVDLYSGGALYNNTSIVGAALATLTDSILVIKNAVFDEKIISFTELRKTLKSNWSNNEELRLFVKKNYPKFGNNIEESDKIAVDIYNRFSSLINNRKNGRGGVFRCGMFSVDWRFWMGEKTAATPDGRLNGEPLSKNTAAVIGQDKNGITAYLNSLVKFDGTNCPDGYVADAVIHYSAVKGEDGMVALKALLLTYMMSGGYAIHFNILNSKTLIKAQKEPDKYKNLQIRLCGWNVRFIDLDKAQQDEFILKSTE